MNLKNKINLSLVTLLLLAILLVVFLIYPLYKDIRNNSQELISQKQNLIYLEDKLESIEEFRKNHREIKQNLEKTKTLFVNSEAPVGFIGFLERTSQACQASIGISPSSITRNAKDPWPHIAFQINSISSFPNFLKFLDKLESSPYLIEIQGLSINQLTERELRSEELETFSVGDIRASLSIKAFAN